MRRIVAALIVCLVALGLLLLVIAASTQPVEIRCYPRLTFAPADVVIVVRVLRHRDNEALLVTADSGETLRSSGIQLDGVEAPITHRFAWRALPAGDYTVAAQLFQNKRRVRTVTTSLQILGSP